MKNSKHNVDRVVAAYRQAVMESMSASIKDLEEEVLIYGAPIVEIVERSILAPADDTGENAPDSLAVMYTEQSLPICMYTNPETVFRWDARANEILGESETVFAEWINGAVLAIYS